MRMEISGPFTGTAPVTPRKVSTQATTLDFTAGRNSATSVIPQADANPIGTLLGVVTALALLSRGGRPGQMGVQTGGGVNMDQVLGAVFSRLGIAAPRPDIGQQLFPFLENPTDIFGGRIGLGGVGMNGGFTGILAPGSTRNNMMTLFGGMPQQPRRSLTSQDPLMSALVPTGLTTGNISSIAGSVAEFNNVQALMTSNPSLSSAWSSALSPRSSMQNMQGSWMDVQQALGLTGMLQL